MNIMDTVKRHATAIVVAVIVVVAVAIYYYRDKLSELLGNNGVKGY